VINGSTSSPAGSVAFPEPPKGSPGEIAACARTLANGGDDLDQVEGGLRNAGSSLASDWQGYAAAAYHASSSALAAVARGGSTEFQECARAVSGYGQALDHAQSELRRLRTSYDDAKQRQASASGLAGQLGTSLAAAHKPGDITRLSGQITQAQGHADQAGIDADAIARRAQGVIDDFKQQAARYQGILEGQQPGRPPMSFGGPFESGPTPFSPLGSPGPGFGVPFTGPGLTGDNGLVPGGLDQYSGVLPTGSDPYKSPIPGFPTYWDSRHENLTSPDDLTNLILLLGPVAAAPLRDLGGDALRALARELGIGAGGRAAVDAAGEQAARQAARGLGRIERILAQDGKPKIGPDGQPETIVTSGRAGAARQAEVAKQLAQRELRIKAVSGAAHVLEAVKLLPLPAGVREALATIAINRYGYTAAFGSQLVQLQDRLTSIGSPVALKAAGLIGRILRGISG
jgi:uncharacterized protein YukE